MTIKYKGKEYATEQLAWFDFLTENLHKYRTIQLAYADFRENHLITGDGQLSEINCDTIRDLPYKCEALRKYHKWIKEQRKRDKLEADRLNHRVYNFKYRKRKKEVQDGNR